jgi:hypothetical protein
MKLTLIPAVLEAVFSFNATAETFIQPSAGAVWVQSDYNSNHHFAAFSVDDGYVSQERTFAILAGYTYSDVDDTATAEAASTDARLSITYEHTMHAFTTWLMPRVEFGKWTLLARPGAGLVYDTMKVNSWKFGDTERSGFELNLSLRADLLYRFSDQLEVGLIYRQDYFEVDTNREVSDYEVNQDRAYYMLTARYQF